MDHRINEKAGEPSSEEERNALVWGVGEGVTFLKQCHSAGSDVNQFSLLMTLHPRFRVTAGKGLSHLSHSPQGGRYSALTSGIIMTTHIEWQEILPKEMKEPKAMDGGLPKPTDILYSKAETMAVGFREKKRRRTLWTEGCPHSDHILSEPDRVLSHTSHVVRTEWCSLLLRQFCSLKSYQHVVRAGRCLQAVIWWVLGSLPFQHDPLASGHLLESHVQEPSLGI